jgi:hypothetical protein
VFFLNIQVVRCLLKFGARVHLVDEAVLLYLYIDIDSIYISNLCGVSSLAM